MDGERVGDASVGVADGGEVAGAVVGSTDAGIGGVEIVAVGTGVALAAGDGTEAVWGEVQPLSKRKYTINRIDKVLVVVVSCLWFIFDCPLILLSENSLHSISGEFFIGHNGQKKADL